MYPLKFIAPVISSRHIILRHTIPFLTVYNFMVSILYIQASFFNRYISVVRTTSCILSVLD